MESKLNQHIGAAELARLLEECRQHGDGMQSAIALAPHLAECASCRDQFEELTSLERQLKGIRTAKSVVPGGSCPDAQVWGEIAGAPTPPAQTLTYIEHASRCDRCGPLLREAVAELIDLQGELSEAERKQIAGLESSRVEWQQRLAQRISGTLRSAPAAGLAERSWWQSWLTVPRMAIAGVSLLAVVGVGSWAILERRTQPAAADLLAKAYTEKRTMELRIGGAGYAPLRVSRGPAASFTSRPPALLKAEALIAAQLGSHPSDPAWLQSQAQADLLEGKYDAAVEALRHGLELEPHSSAILTDLATAYFQRAQQEGRKEDLGAAYEYLSQALRLRPDDPIALFNRAIVAEHQFLYQQALEDWEHYLRLDPGSQWVEEARNRADSVREKLKEHSSKALPLLSPAEVAALAVSSSSDSAGQGTNVDQRIEEYLHEAVRSWLTEAFGSRDESDPGAAKALFFLADLTARQHGDLWLTDLLRGSSASNFPQAANALARAVQANDGGNYDVSHQQAALAEKLFSASGNMAGVLRAKFEDTFSDQMSRHSEQCRQKASTALRESARYSYAWVQIQLGLEASTCSGLMGDLGAHDKEALRAMDRSDKADYGALYLRALGFVVGGKFNTGNRSDGWKLLSAGLERFWSGQYPSRRGYNLYTEFDLDADPSGHPNLQMSSWREAKALIDHDESLLLRAQACTWMANAALKARLLQVAERQYADAARLLAAAPRTDASRNAQLQMEVRASQVEAHQGQFDDGIARLTVIQDQIRSLSNNYLAQMFYSTLGELQLGRHRDAEAEQALQPALALAEQNLATLRSETERTGWSKNAAPAYLGLVEAELAQGRSAEALATYEWYLGAPQRMAADSSANRTLTNAGMPDPSWLPSRLPLLAEDTVLAYAVLPDGLGIWVYDDRGVSGQWIPNSIDSLQELASRFHDLSSDPKSDLSALRRDAQSLYESLITPVEQHLAPGRNLVIEADGWLAEVPFEALMDANGHYLIERAPIVHSNGQYSQASLHNDSGISADLPALVVGSTASSSADELIPLPGVAAEAEGVARSFRSVHLLEGEGATLSAVQSQLPGMTVFHFAGHSLAAPAGSGLMLGDVGGKAKAPRLMDAAAMQHLHLHSLQLAVLSACSTASGDVGLGGFESVTDAFLRAGVPHVVASRWTVDSVETRGFVEDFYRSALSGQTVSEAVRTVSRDMLANPRTSHPYYWSAFAAYGRP